MCVFVFMCMRRLGVDSVVGLQVYTNKYSFYVSAQCPNLDFHASIEDMLSTESFPQFPIISNVIVFIVWMHHNLFGYPCHWTFTLFTISTEYYNLSIYYTFYVFL